MPNPIMTNASTFARPSWTPVVLLPVVAAAGALVQFAFLWRGVNRARALAARGRPFERRVAAQGPRILVLGDSTGVGIGALAPEDSIAGLLASEFPDADIVNVSQSGARVDHVVKQARRCSRLGERYDLAVLHVGGNDVLHATPPKALGESCRQLMKELSRVAERTVWLGHLNIGLAPLFPRPYSWIMAARSRAAARIFAAWAARHGVTFVDFSAPEHSLYFSTQRRESFAVDGLHPNSSAYRYGYAAARAALRLHAGAATAGARTQPLDGTSAEPIGEPIDEPVDEVVADGLDPQLDQANRDGPAEWSLSPAQASAIRPAVLAAIAKR